MVRIMADKSADIPLEFVKEHDLKILPFYINMGDESILADAEYGAEEFYNLLKTAEENPKTSQCTPDFVEDLFRELGKDGEPVVYVSIPQNASGAFTTANMMAQKLIEEENMDITVIDSKTFSMGIGVPVMEAVVMAENGATKEEIISFLTETFERDSVYFVVDDLGYLKKGGRIKASTAVIGEILDIKPVLTNKDGMVEVYQKVRGGKKALAKLVEEAENKMDCPEEGEIYLLSADAEEKAELLKKMLQKKVMAKEIKCYPVGPVITTHAGLGVVGIYFKHKK